MLSVIVLFCIHRSLYHYYFVFVLKDEIKNKTKTENKESLLNGGHSTDDNIISIGDDTSSISHNYDTSTTDIPDMSQLINKSQIFDPESIFILIFSFFFFFLIAKIL